MTTRHPPRTRRSIAPASVFLLLLVHACGGPAADDLTGPDVRAAAAAASPITVDAVAPDEIDQGAVAVDLQILGTGFEPGTAVSFERNGKPAKKLTTNSTTWVSDTELIANVDVAIDAEPATYDVVAKKGPSKGVGSELLFVRENAGQGPFDPETPLSLTFDQLQSGPNGERVIGDGDSDADGTSDLYVNEIEDVSAILRSNGNLNFDAFTGNRKKPPTRTVAVRIHSPETGVSDRGTVNLRINSNDPCPDNPNANCAPGEVDATLRDMAVSTTTVERTLIGFVWTEGSVENVLRYGYTCDGVHDRIPAERAFAMHPDPDTWVVWGSDVTWCSHQTKGNHPWVTVSDDARADFSFTITRLP